MILSHPSTATTMSSQKRQGEELEGDITFITTPAPALSSKFETGEDCGVEITNVSTIECQLTSIDIN